MVSHRPIRVVVESLEDRRLLSTTILSNGLTSASLRLGVDPYGAFGLTPTGVPTQYADFTVGQLGSVNRSYVLFSGSGQALTEDGQPGTAPTLTPISFDSTSPLSTVSTFNLSGNDAAGIPYSYQVQLTQTLSPVTLVSLGRYSPDDANNFQSTLLQSYHITNLLGTTTSFNLTRYFESQSGGGVDSQFFGTAGFLDGGRTLVQAEVNNADFVQIHSYGGSFTNAAINHAQQAGGTRTGGLDAAISQARGIPANTPQVPSGTGLLDSTNSFFDALAQQYTLTTGPRESVDFTTATTFGQQTPIGLRNLVGTHVDVQGDFAFSSPSYNYAFPMDSGGNLLPLTVTIDRLSGTNGAVSVVLNSGSSLPATSYTINPTTVNFADGQSSADVTITFAPAVTTEVATIQLTLSPVGGNAAAASPSFTTINVRPQAAVFTIAEPAIATEGQGTVGVLINRTGNINGLATVFLHRTTSVGPDFSAQVDFLDGETSKVVQVPVIDTAVDTGTRTETLSLVGAKPGNGTTGVTSISHTPTVTLTVTEHDAAPPNITSLSTQGNKKSLTGIALVFSEDVRGVGDLSNYVLASRSEEGAYGSGKTKGIAIASASYDPASHTVVLIPSTPLATNKNYQVTVFASPLLVDASGNGFFQDPANNRPNYTAYFARATKISYVDNSGDRVKLSMQGGYFDLVRWPNGDAATVTLFGTGGSPFFKGSVDGDSSTIANLINPIGAGVDLKDITVLNTPVVTPH